jgi:branched-chain amino acid transport system ATP-binding protein
MSLLQLEDITVSYRGVPAVRNLSLTVAEGETVCLIGANGAGKSSTLKAALGLVPLAGGKIRFAGQEINGRRTESIVGRGIGVAPEGRRVFPGLSVLENLKVGHRKSAGALARCLEDIYQLFPKLAQRRAQMGWSLSGGEQQMLTIGRAMMGKPRLLILDEPSLGLAPLVTADVFHAISEIGKRGTAVLVVEQNAKIALSAAARAYVLETGKLVLEGKASELGANPKVMSAFLGEA